MGIWSPRVRERHVRDGGRRLRAVHRRASGCASCCTGRRYSSTTAQLLGVASPGLAGGGGSETRPTRLRSSRAARRVLLATRTVALARHAADAPHMPDVTDFLGLLSDLKGQRVYVQLGVRADDVPDADRPMAKIRGVLDQWRQVDDWDRPGHGVAWVPIDSTTYEPETSGFYVEGDLVADVIIRGDRRAKITYGDRRYITVIG